MPSEQEHVDTHVKLMAWGIKPTIVHSLQRLYDSQAVSRVEEDPFLAIREAGGSYEYVPVPRHQKHASNTCPMLLALVLAGNSRQDYALAWYSPAGTGSLRSGHTCWQPCCKPQRWL